jgi:chorismate mutase-like protein
VTVYARIVDSTENTGRSLPELRAEIDEIDAAIVELLARRLDVCRDVAHVKQGSDASVIQPQRVREVLSSRRQWAINAGVDADFVEQLFRVLLIETHRIETAAGTSRPAPTKGAGGVERSPLDTVATAIDHVVVVVPDVDDASKLFATLGFSISPTEDQGVVIATAGGVMIALIAPNGDPAVAQHLETHGAGISRVVIEVLNTGLSKATPALGLVMRTATEGKGLTVDQYCEFLVETATERMKATDAFADWEKQSKGNRPRPRHEYAKFT